MSDLPTLFGGKNNALVNSDLFKSLMDMNKTIAGGGGGGGKRISIRGGRFRMVVNGEQISVRKEDWINLVVLDAANVARTYYEGTFDPENPTAPTCWSHDTRTPAEDVPEDQRQAARCADCPMNIKGSGQGDSRACRFSQRFAVALEGKLDEVYQLQLPATSIFGEAQGDRMGMQAYARFLNAHNTPMIAVLTKVYFDEDSNTPKLYFKPERPLDEEELQEAVAARETEDAKQAITFTVSQTDRVEDKPAKPKAETQDKAPVEASDEDDSEEPPKKVVKKEPPAAKKVDLAALVDEWDDE